MQFTVLRQSEKLKANAALGCTAE